MKKYKKIYYYNNVNIRNILQKYDDVLGITSNK